MKLLVSDFDGTFYDKNYLKNIELIKKYNIDFVIATGRNFKSLKKDLKLKCKYYICNDGGYILDNDEKLIYRNYINRDTVEKIHSRILELGYENYFLDNIKTFSKDLIDDVNKISVKIKDSNVLDDINYLLKDLNNVYAYISTNWINILSIDSKKEKGIKFIENDYDDIIVIGNDINDYSMLKEYNGYLITDQINKEFKTINSFLELESIIKK